jgi:acetyl-CoA C-acetyltransferase
VVRSRGTGVPDEPFEIPYGPVTVNMYAMCAMRHMHQFGTTSEQLAWVKVAASHHAQHNPNAVLQEVVTVKDVLDSPMISDPLHRLDCCVVSDGGGALIVARPEIAKSLKRPLVKILGAAEAPKHQMGGKVDLTYSAAKWIGPARLRGGEGQAADIKHASIYDSFTHHRHHAARGPRLRKKGEGASSCPTEPDLGTGKLPFNTDGGGLCNNHPANRGGITKVIEAVRQLRGEAHPKVR